MAKVDVWITSLIGALRVVEVVSVDLLTIDEYVGIILLVVRVSVVVLVADSLIVDEYVELTTDSLTAYVGTVTSLVVWVSVAVGPSVTVDVIVS